jgi:8-oxo-dGTP diphosphatase
MEYSSKKFEDYTGDLSQLLAEFSKKFPHFPDGRIDYTYASEAPVVDCFVRYEGRLLILQRSDKVILLKNSWNMISGFLDEPGKSLFEKAYEEMEEETGISRKSLIGYIEGLPYKRPRGVGRKTWYVFPALIDIDTRPSVKLDWEHTGCAWVKPEELKNYDPAGRIEFVLSRIPYK